MKRITYRHIMPSGEPITSTLLIAHESEWPECPESRSPIWASFASGRLVYALAVHASLAGRVDRDGVLARDN